MQKGNQTQEEYKIQTLIGTFSFQLSSWYWRNEIPERVWWKYSSHSYCSSKKIRSQSLLHLSHFWRYEKKFLLFALRGRLRWRPEIHSDCDDLEETLSSREWWDSIRMAMKYIHEVYMYMRDSTMMNAKDSKLISPRNQIHNEERTNQGWATHETFQCLSDIMKIRYVWLHWVK